MIVEQLLEKIENINELSQPVDNIIRDIDISIRDGVKEYSDKVQWFVKNVTLELDYALEKETEVKWDFEFAFSNKGIYLSHDGKKWETNKKKNGGITAVIRGNAPLGNKDGRLEIALVMGLDHIYTLVDRQKVISKKSNKNDIVKDIVDYYISVRRNLGR